MKKPLRPCNHSGCLALTTDGWCDAHRPKKERKTSEEWHALYTSPRYGWKKRRAEQLAREPFCRECAKAGRRVYAEDVDHIQPHQGDVDAFMAGELQSLCHSCHSKKTMKELRKMLP